MELLRLLCDLYEFTLIVFDLCIDFVKYKFLRRKIERDECDIRGKCVVVTGGSKGIGKSCAKEFARGGAIVVIGSSNVEIGERTVDEIRTSTGNTKVTFLKLDLADLNSVEEFAKKVSTDHPKIKILLNNAGIGTSKDENIKTKDGLNIHVSINYMGHFLLTHLLMDNLRAETKPRIVSMTSTFLLMSQLNVDNLNMDKTMLALLTKELGKRNGVNAYALCSGIVKTDIFVDSSLFIRLLLLLLSSFSTDPDAKNNRHKHHVIQDIEHLLMAVQVNKHKYPSNWCLSAHFPHRDNVTIL